MPLILLVSGTALGLWLVDFIVNRYHPLNLKMTAWLQWWNVLGLDTIFIILWLIGQTRKRVVVEEFEDYRIAKKLSSSDQSQDQNKVNNANQPQSIAKGLATLLVVRLAQIREVFQVVNVPNEQRIVTTDAGLTQSGETTLNVDDVKGFLKDAVSAESKFSFGFLQIPVGTIMTIFGRIFQGPRIIGTLHGDGDSFVLTAQRIGGKQSYSWRVDNASSDGKEVSRLDEMITELAYHIFADIELVGSVRWKALKAFTEGLQAYRQCLNTPRDRILNLRRAERKLLETVAEDETFALAYYNLGVIYTELGQFENDFLAAEAAFLEAIAKKAVPWRAYNDVSWRAYYALMIIRFKQKQYKFVIQLCNRVIALKPDAANRARAYHWKGLAQRLIDQRSFAALNPSIETRKKSVACSWYAVCIAELKGQGNDRTKSSSFSHLTRLASICLVDLAVAYSYQAQLYERESEKYERVKRMLLKKNVHRSLVKFRKVVCLSIKQVQLLYRRSEAFRKSQNPFRQALFLSPTSANNHFEFGKMSQSWKKYKQAIHEFECATQLQPGNIEFWAYLATAYALNGDLEEMYYACKQVLEGASAIGEEEVFERISEAYRSIQQVRQSKRISSMNKFLIGLDEDVKRGKSGILEDKLDYYKQGGQEWEYAQILNALGKVYLGRDHPDPQKAKECFLQAIEKLEKNYPQEIKLQGLRAWLARALLEVGEYDEALQQVERALALDPLSPFVRDVLAEVYDKLNQYEQAINAWQESLLRKPYDPDIYYNIGGSYIGLGQQCREPKRRNEALRQSIIYLRQALALYKSNQQKEKGAVRYLLGLLHLEWSEYEEAISNFKIAHALKYSPLSSTFYLGYVYLQNKGYDEAIDIFRILLEELREKEDEEQDTEEEMTQGTLLVLTNWGLSTALVERGGKFNLTEAQEYIESAERCIDTLKTNEVAEVYSLANHYDTKGWIYYSKGEATKAIPYLEHALSLSSKAKTYLHLALAYEYSLQETPDLVELHSKITQVRLHCQHVQELDVKKEYEKSVQDLLQHLEVYEQISKDILQAKLTSYVTTGKVVSAPEQNQQSS